MLGMRDNKLDFTEVFFSSVVDLPPKDPWRLRGSNVVRERCQEWASFLTDQGACQSRGCYHVHITEVLWCRTCAM
jgi:hypothetical protein